MDGRELDSYKDLCTQFYDLDKPEPPPAELDFYWNRYARHGGAALEAMCGSGRFLVPFARRGADIDGVDASPQMLAACRARAGAAGVEVGLFAGFLEDFETPRRYRFVFCPAGSFALIPHAGQPAALRALARHMLPGAELALEMCFPSGLGEGPSSADGERRVRRPDGAVIVLTWESDRRMRYELVREGRVLRTERETFTLHPTPRAEFERMLRHTGFTNLRVWRPHEPCPARDGDGSAVFVCERS